MIYLSADYILNAINQLSPVHPFLGITFLTCKKEKLLIDETMPFLMDRKTKEFMSRVHKICPTSNSFFQPYRTIKSKQWLIPSYPSGGLQAINTQTFKTAFIRDKDEKKWGWASDYISQIAKIAVPSDKKRIPVAAMAIWVLKDCKWSDTASIDDVVDRFISDYHITQEEFSAFFKSDTIFPNTPAFQNECVTWNQLSSSLSFPPDAQPDYEGTLSKLELINVGPCDQAEMEMSPRLNIITGDNGLGKTFLMDCAWWALTNTWAGNEARPKYAEGSKRSYIRFLISGKHQISTEKKVLYDNKNLTWKRTADTATIPGLIVYALVDGSYAVWDPSKRNDVSSKINVFSKDQVWNGHSNQIEGLIRDWVMWQNTPQKYPFEIFKHILAEMSPPDLGPLVPGSPIRIPNDSREIPTIQYPYGVVPITNSSAGVGRIVTLVYLMVWAWNEHKENCRLKGIKPDSRIVVMVDELEAHLHPKWQRTILTALVSAQRYLANELEVQFILSTHSPLVMASAETIFDEESDKLFQLRLDTESENAILSEETFVKYGQVNSWLTSPVFNLGEARSMDAEYAIEHAKSLQLDDDPSDEAVQTAHNHLIRNLSQSDPFWPRWIYFAESHGVIL